MSVDMTSYQGDLLEVQGQDPAFAGMDSKQKFVDIGIPGTAFDGAKKSFDLTIDIPLTGADADAVRTYFDMALTGSGAAYIPNHGVVNPAAVPPTMGDMVTIQTQTNPTSTPPGTPVPRVVTPGLNPRFDAPVVQTAGTRLLVNVYFDTAPAAGAHWTNVRLYYMARKTP